MKRTEERRKYSEGGRQREAEIETKEENERDGTTILKEKTDIRGKRSWLKVKCHFGYILKCHRLS